MHRHFYWRQLRDMKGSADPELIFGRDTEGKYGKALRKIGIDPGMLSSESGHA